MELVPLPCVSHAQDAHIGYLLAVSRDGEQAIAVLKDKKLALFRAEEVTILENSQFIKRAAFSADGSRYALAFARHQIVCASETHAQIARWGILDPECVRFVRDSPHTLVVVTQQSEVRVLDSVKGTNVLKLRLNHHQWWWPVVSEDGTKVLFTTTRGALVYDVETGAQRVVGFGAQHGGGAHISNDGLRARYTFFSADLVTGAMVRDNGYYSASPSGRVLSTRECIRGTTYILYVQDSLGRWRCKIDAPCKVTEMFASERLIVCVHDTGALMKFRIRPAAWNQALALFCGVSGSLKRFLERDGDHAVMHKMLECLLF